MIWLTIREHYYRDVVESRTSVAVAGCWMANIVFDD